MVTLIPGFRTVGSFMPMTVIAGDDGTFEIGQVIAGTYRITANVSEGDAGFGAVSFDVVPDDPATGPDTITVGSVDITGLRVVAGRR